MYVYYVRMCLYNRMHEVFIKMSVYCSCFSFFSLCGMYSVWGRVCVFVCVCMLVLVASNNKLFKL